MTRTGELRGARLLRRTARQVGRSDDSGATLIMALIFVTVVALVIASVLSFVDTSLRTTVVVRNQAAQAAAADGAAQIAINALRKNLYAGTGSCFGASGTLPLGDFYQSHGNSYSASVNCAFDAADSGSSGGSGGASTSPGQAILTYGKNAADGLNVTLGGSDILQVHGNIYSNSSITVKKNLTGNAQIKALGACAALSGGTLMSATGTLTTTPPGPKCNLGPPQFADPAYNPPAAPTGGTGNVPTCVGSGAKTFTFQPGRLYTDVASLNKLTTTDSTNKCQGSTLWFPPGIYYFNLPSQWTIQTGWVLGGKTPGGGTPGLKPSMPGACQAAIPPNPPAGWVAPVGTGVEFVLGGATRIAVQGDSHLELCGEHSAIGPPIVLYGLNSALGSMPAENGCVTMLSTAGGCAVLSSDSFPKSELYMQGTTYVRDAWVNINVNNRSDQVLRYGIVSRKLDITATGSANLSQPLIEVPDVVSPGPLRTVVTLDVYVCPGTAPCPPGGTVKLKVKVGFGDPSGTPTAGKREVTVYNWSVQRA